MSHDAMLDLCAGSGPLITKGPYLRAFLSSGGGIRTRDLRVMSPTSYLTAPPRGVDQRM
jgi:hypothetical protein